MARHASTYRQARRAAWKEIGGSWAQFNGPVVGQFNKSVKSGRKVTHVSGTVRERYIGSPAARSKYAPHIGSKQRAKGAAKC